MKHGTGPRYVRRVIMCAVLSAVCACLASGPHLEARCLTDIAGKRVVVPDYVRSAWGTSPPATYLLYSLDPSVLAGLTTPLKGWEKAYLRRDMQKLPVLGGWYGQGNVPNIEMVLKVKPDIIVVPALSAGADARTTKTLRNIPIPAITVDVSKLSSYPDAFLYLGEALGRKERAEKLAEYARKTIGNTEQIVRGIPEKNRVSVYYAEGEDGLTTECHVSMHVELIGLAGGKNVHRCVSKTNYGMDKVSMEQVLMYDPDVILVFERNFFKKVFLDARWRQIKAVKNKRVYLIPRQPFNWFDRPPSFMRLLGLKWLLNVLHPDVYPVDIVKETQIFFKLFLGVTLSQKEAGDIIQFQVPKLTFTAGPGPSTA